MFDISWTELLIIAVVAVVVVGPKDLPRMMRVTGQWMGRARAMADQFRRSFDDMARQAELEEMRAEMMKTYKETSLAKMQHETEIMLGNIPPDTPFVEDEASRSIAPLSLREAAAPPPEFAGDPTSITPPEPVSVPVADPVPVPSKEA